MPGRKFTAGSQYRYGFNGKENDNEVKGEGNQQDYGMRIYDPRLGRFQSVDPITKEYPELTPYQFASNIPIYGIDRDGLELYGNMWLFDIWLEWKFGDPTGVKSIKEGIQHKNTVQSKEMSYSGNVPPAIESRLDRLNNVQANVSIARGVAQLSKFNIETSFNITSSIVPLGELGVFLKGLKYSEGNSIVSKAWKDGVEIIIAQTDDELRYLSNMNAKALYGGGKGSQGTILITKDAPRSHILEEAIHHEQRIKYGDNYFYSNRNKLEVEAQDKLLKIGKKEGWSKKEINEIEKAKSFWQKALRSEKK